MINHIPQFVDWLLVEKGYSSHTADGYQRDVLEFVTFLKEESQPQSVTPLMVQKFVGSLYGSNASASVARKLSALRTFFRYLQREKILAHDPLSGVVGPKQGQHMPLFLTVDEVFSLLEAPQPSDTFFRRDRALMELLYSTGMRVSELVATDMEDVDFHNEMIRVRGKGQKERIIPFGRAANDALTQYLSERDALIISRINRGRDPEQKALFLNNRGSRLTVRSVERFVQAYGLRVGLQNTVTPHALRHSFATHLLEMGADLRTVQELLGHVSLSTTQKYTHLNIDHLARVYDEAHPMALHQSPTKDEG